MDESDDDLRTFMAYLIGAIDSSFPGSVNETRSMLKGTDQPPLEMLVAILINEVTTIGEDFILVLDDYYKIRNSDVHDLVRRLLDNPPNNMHLAIASRSDPPFPILDLRARGHVTEIRVQDLRFSLEETTSFLRDVMQINVDEHSTVIIEEKTEGWVTGLRLAVLSTRNCSDLQSMIAGLPDNNRYVMDYMISEVISRQPADIQDYLLSTAILDRFCASLCESICLSDLASRTCTLSGSTFIEHITQNNMFCIPLDDRKKWFRFHHLFGQLLQRELKRRLGEKTFLDLHNRAGNWYAQNEYLDEALKHMLAAKNNTAARKLVIGKRYELTKLEQWHRLERWVESLPEADLHKDPELLIILAWIHENRERIPQMFQVLDSIEKQISEKAEAVNEHLEITGECNALRAAQFYIGGDIERARHYADLSIEQIPKSHPNERAYALLVWALIHQMQGEVTEARKVVYGFLREDDSNVSNYDARLLLTLCIIDWLEGDLSGLEQNAVQLLALGSRLQLLESMCIANYYLGVSSYYLGRSQQALTYLDSAVKNEIVIDPNTYIHGNCARVLLFQSLAQSEKVKTLIQEMLDFAIQSKNTGFVQIIHAIRAELAFRQGFTSEALKWAREYAFEPLKQSLRFFVPQMTQAKILTTVGTASDREQAHDMINRMQQFFAAKHNVHCLIDVLALKAICLDGKGESEAAIEALTTALNLAHRSRRLEPFLSLGDQMATLLKDVSRQGRFKSYVSKILTSMETTASPVDHNTATHQSILNGQALDQTQLTNREIDIMQLLANRLSNKEISAKLFISLSTVKRHASNIYAKLSVSNRQEAVAKARSLGLL